MTPQHAGGQLTAPAPAVGAEALLQFAGASMPQIPTPPPLVGGDKKRTSSTLAPNTGEMLADPSDSASGQGSSSKRCKLALSVDDFADVDVDAIVALNTGAPIAAGGSVELEYNVTDLISKLLSGQYSVLGPAERSVANNPTPMIATLWNWLKDEGFISSLKNASPLQVDRDDRGFAEPFSAARGKVALGEGGAGHYLTSVTFFSLNFFDLTDMPSVSWNAIRSLFLHFFSTGPVEFPGEFVIPVYAPRGINYLRDTDQLPPSSLHLLMAPEFCYAAVLAMFVHQQVSHHPMWERFIRSTIVHIYGKVANEKHWRLNKRYMQSFDLPILAENTQLTAVEQGDVMKATIDHIRTLSATGRKNVSHKQVIEHFVSEAKATNAKHPMASEKLVRVLTSLATAFDSDTQSREALVRMEARHGRAKDTLHMSPTKLSVLPSAIPSVHRHMMPEIIACIDVLCWRGQIVGGLAAGVTTIGLAGKNKRSGSEPSPEDTGLISILLARLQLRDFIDTRFGSKVDEKLRSIYSNILRWEQTFPAEQTMVQAASSGVSITVDTAYLNNLPAKDKLWKEFQHDLMDGEYNEKIALALATNKVNEPMPLIQSIPEMLESFNKLCTAFDEADKKALAPAAAGQNDAAASVTSTESTLFNAMPLIADQDMLESIGCDASASAVAQGKLRHRASTCRASSCSFVVVPPTSPKSVVMAAIQNHPLWKHTLAATEFGKSHILILLDPSKGPETGNPTRQPPSKSSSSSFILPRLQSAMELATTPGVFFLVYDGLRPQNRPWLTSQLLQIQKTLKDANGNAQKPMSFFEANMCLTYEGIKSGSGLFAALDWE